MKKNNRAQKVLALLTLITSVVAPGISVSGKAFAADGISHEQDDLVLAIKEHNSERVRRILSNPEALKNLNFAVTNTYGIFQGNLLNLAVSLGHARIVQEILNGIKAQAKGENTDAALNQPNPNGRTALNLAAINGDVEIVDALLDNGARINQLSQDGWTSVHLAAERGNLLALQHLIAKGAKLDITIQNGDTPLHSVASTGHLEVLKYLITKGLPIDQVNISGRTPLHLAAANNQVESVKYLIDKGADLKPMDSSGKTALFIASEKRNTDVVDSLVTAKGIELGNEFRLAFEQSRPDLIKTYMNILNAKAYDTPAECYAVMSVYKENLEMMTLNNLNASLECHPCDSLSLTNAFCLK
jgi:ankyrin repeat protein